MVILNEFELESRFLNSVVGCEGYALINVGKLGRSRSVGEK